MKGVRFYEEFSSKRRGISEGNCIAVLAANGYQVVDGDRIYDAIVAPFGRPNCSPSSGSVASGYLRKKCKRVTEAQARKIHPRLFQLLDRS